MQKSLSAKKWQKNGVFYLNYFMQKFSVYNFFGVNSFLHLFQRIWTQHRNLRFMIPISNLLKRFYFAYCSIYKGREEPSNRHTIAANSIRIGIFKIFKLSSLSCIFLWSSHADMMTNLQSQYWRRKHVFLRQYTPSVLQSWVTCSSYHHKWHGKRAV